MKDLGDNLESNFLHSGITKRILKAYFDVYNTLGYGFLEKVYEKAMIIELNKLGLKVESQKAITVFYEGTKVGDYYADLVVEDKVIVELKAVENLIAEHEAQLVNYLRATEIEVGLLLNFGKEVQFKRRVLTQSYKNHSKS